MAVKQAKKERILIIGADARSQAMGWKLLQSPHVQKLFFAPGNAGTKFLGSKAENVNIALTEFDKQIEFAKTQKITLVIFSPETPLIKGGVDRLKEAGIQVFGPNKAAAQLEGSKVFSSMFNASLGIPQPKFQIIGSYSHCLEFIKNPAWKKYVMKADGEAAGKGVFLPKNPKEAKDFAKRVFIDREFGESGNYLVMQERLEGREISVIIITDGKSYKVLPVVEDHKQVHDGDKGPNTGGMGVVGPVSFVTDKQLTQIKKLVLDPLIGGLQTYFGGYTGAIFVGLMLTKKGTQVLEYNTRFGDPEMQVHMRLWESDFLEAITATIDGKLAKHTVKFRDGAAVSVILAAENYPGTPVKGDRVAGIETITDEDVVVFHAGTTEKNKDVITSGGRVVGITSYFDHKDQKKALAIAIEKAYNNIGQKKVHFRGMHYRKDIGRRK